MDYSINEILTKKVKLVKSETTHCGYVYFLIQNNKVVYVGKSENVEARIFSHIKNKIFDSYSIFEVNHQDMNIIEGANIMRYKPIYNKNINLDHGYISLKYIKIITGDGMNVIKKRITQLQINLEPFNCNFYMRMADYNAIYLPSVSSIYGDSK